MKSKYSSILSIVAVLVSIAALVIALCRNNSLVTEWEWAGVLVTALSLLVMIIVGVNVYSIFDVNKIQAKFEDLHVSVDEKFARLQTNIDHNCWKLHNTTMSSHMILAMQLEDWNSAALFWAMGVQNPYNTIGKGELATNAILNIKVILNCNEMMQVDQARVRHIPATTLESVVTALTLLVPASIDAALIIAALMPLEKNDRP